MNSDVNAKCGSCVHCRAVGDNFRQLYVCGSVKPKYVTADQSACVAYVPKIGDGSRTMEFMNNFIK